MKLRFIITNAHDYFSDRFYIIFYNRKPFCAELFQNCNISRLFYDKDLKEGVFIYFHGCETIGSIKYIYITSSIKLLFITPSSINYNE
jgi:hypothetical protein